MTKQELKPCPFCGGKADWCRCSEEGCHLIECKGCGFTMDNHKIEASSLPILREAIAEQWNKRAGQAAQEPDMIWDKGDPESNWYGNCLWSFAREYNAETDFEGDLEVMVGVSLPNRIMRIKQVGEDEHGYRIIEAEWVEPTPPESE